MSIRRTSTSYIHSLDNPNSFGNQKHKYSNVTAGLATAKFFTSNSTYTRPSNVLYIDLLMVGGGGGGGQNNYGAGGGGGNIYYVKKLYIGDADTYYCWIGTGGVAGGVVSTVYPYETIADFGGLTAARAAAFGEGGQPTIFSSNANYASFNFLNMSAIGNAKTIISPGGGGGGANAGFGFMIATGGGSGSNAASGTNGRVANESWSSGHGFNGGAGSAGGGGGGGSTTAVGGSASGNIGGNGANGPDLQAPLPATFVNSSTQTITTRFGGGGGGAGATTQGTGGTGGGGNGGSAGVANTGGGGGGGAAGGSGVLIIWEHTS
jgi:hypothetical protein